MRALVLFAIVVGALVALLWTRPDPSLPGEVPRLAWVATARQLGVVGYRDPVGALSPDGTRLAYSEGREVRVVPVGGGTPLTLPPGEGQVRHLAWAADDQLVVEDTGAAARWWRYQFGAGRPGSPGPSGRRRTPTVPVNDLRQLAWSADGQWVAGLATGTDGPELWRISADGARAEHRRIEGRPAAPAWTPAGEIACVTSESGRPRISLPCGEATLRLSPDVDVVGPLAFSPDGARVYFASPNAQGTVDLWVADRATTKARRLTGFSRDTYAPSIAKDGAVVFKVQNYRTFVADAPASGGASRQLATFQSETPSWHPTQPTLAFTFGTWRRVLDDAKYPDIAQEIGTLDLTAALPAAKPAEVIAQSTSEDQAMAWSPNGRWIALHSHREMSDDVWLRAADGRAADRRLTFLGRGAEVGWPRWSPDGQSVLLDGARKRDGRSVIYVIGVDQATGETTSDLREVRVDGFAAELTHAEWLPSGTTIVALAREGPGRQAIVTIPHHRWAAVRGVSLEQRARFLRPRRVCRRPIGGLHGAGAGRVLPDLPHPARAAARRCKSRPIASDKSQPSWSPDGARIAFTVWSYDAVFWMMR